jgi:hypothetical protein
MVEDMVKAKSDPIRSNPFTPLVIAKLTKKRIKLANLFTKLSYTCRGDDL